MNKTTVFIMIMSGLMIFFYLTGLATTNPLVNLLLNPQNMTSSSFYLTLSVLFVGGVGSIILGLFGSQNVKLAAAGIFVPLLIGLLWSFIEVYITIASVNRPFAVLIVGPFLLMFFVTMYELFIQ